jgi:hypothetical protein
VYNQIKDYVSSHMTGDFLHTIQEHGYLRMDNFVNALPIRIVAGSPADEELTFCAYLPWDNSVAVMEIDVPVMQARRELRLTHRAQAAAVAQPVRDQLDYSGFSRRKKNKKKKRRAEHMLTFIHVAQMAEWEPRVRPIIEQAGGRYKGIQDYGTHGIFVLFDEPETGSTCMSLVQQITPEFVAQKLQETRAKFNV